MAVEQVDVPTQLVVLGVVGVVTGADGEVDRAAGDRPSGYRVQRPHHGFGDVRREHLLCAVGGLERQLAGEG